jgi:hypothetical protein
MVRQRDPDRSDPFPRLNRVRAITGLPPLLDNKTVDNGDDRERGPSND